VKNNKIEISKGGGWTNTLFGIPFLGFGLFGLKNGAVHLMEGRVPGAFMLILMACAFLAMGLGLSLGRKKTWFDGDRKTITHSWGLLSLVLRETHHRWDDFQEVALRKETSRKQSGMTNTFYHVYLEGRKPSLKVDTSFNYPQQLKLAESIAKFVNLPLRDSAT
jgi:hypothetical protein